MRPIEHPRPLLIVDDDEDSHLLLKRSLAKVGVTHAADSVTSGEEALAYLEKCVAGKAPFPALVFLDAKMPGMTGFEVLAWIREKQLLGCLSLVMLTSSDDPRDVNRAMSLGAHSYLTKPPPDDTLREVVSSAIKLASVSAGPGSRAALNGARKIRVLTVDDSTFARRTTRRLLESAGYEVEEAASGAEALERCSVHPPDIVLLDLVMDSMGGLEVIAQLRARRANVRIVVVSADTQDLTREAAVRAGALGYVTKPINAEKITAVASAVLTLLPWN